MWITWNQEKIYQSCLARWLYIAPNTINSLFFLFSFQENSLEYGLWLGNQFSCSVMSNSLEPKDCSTPGFPVHHQLPELTQTNVHQVSDAITPPHPLLSPSPLSFNLSQHQGLLKGVSSSHKAAKVLEFQLQHQSFQWRFRIDFLQDRLDGFPCSPRDSQESSPTPQFKSINSLVLSFPYSPNFTSIHDYCKNCSFDKMDFVGKVMSLLFNMLSRLIIAFLPRSKHLPISWLQSPSSVTLEPPKIKSATVCIVSPSICHEVMGPDAMILVFWMLRFFFLI